MSLVDPRELFTVHGAVTLEKRHQFAGREDMVERCLDELAIEGSTLVIFGERGVGKTSLGWQLVGPLSGDSSLLKERNIRPKLLRDEEFYIIWCTCNSWMTSIYRLVFTLVNDPERQFTLRSNFPEIFNDTKLIKKLSDMYKHEVPTLAASLDPRLKINPKRQSDSDSAPESDSLVSFLFLEELLEAARERYPDKKGIILFLDEFDRIQDKAGITHLFKVLNNVRFVIFGVGASHLALTGEHVSVGRKIYAREVPLFTLANVNWFFDRVQERSQQQVIFTKKFRSEVYSLSSGFPWVVQQLGFYCLLDAIPNEELLEIASPITLDEDNLTGVLPTFLKEKFTGDDVNLEELSEVARGLLKTLSATEKGRWSERELINTIRDDAKGFYEASLEQLKNSGLVYEQGSEVRIKDPLTKILIGLAIKQGII